MFLDLILPDTHKNETIAAAILACNEKTQPYGLSLTPEEAQLLAQGQSAILVETGRLEFGSKTIPNIILAFCDSPYVYSAAYPETLEALTEIFYYYKNETLELISDDDLIDDMKALFNGFCQGSLDQLRGRALEDLSSHLKNGYSQDSSPDGSPDPVDDEEVEND